MPRVQRIRLGAIVMLALAAVAIGCGSLLAIVSWDQPAYIVPVSLTFVGATVMIGLAMADLRFASMLERRGLR